MLYKQPSLNDYEVLIFDMDGLLLNSLDNLSQALTGCVEKDMSKSDFAQFLEYDRANPGKSRYEKFEYAYRAILQSLDHEKKIEKALLNFGKKSLSARMESDLDVSIFELRQSLESKTFILLSNCANEQIKEVVTHHNLNSVFQSNVYGTPPNKLATMKRLILENPGMKVLSISDSLSDAEVADDLCIDFLYVQRFARGNTEWVKDEYFKVSKLSDLLNSLPNNH
jgi:phosphoglycolate phosphatase-like HAD superfamily hydrolase